MGRALVLVDANWGGPGGRRQLASFERGAWLRGEEGEDGRELCGGGEREVISWFVPDLPLLEKSAANLGAQAEVGPWGSEVVGRVALGSEFCGSIS